MSRRVNSRPVAGLWSDFFNMPLRTFGELEACHLYNSIMFRAVSDVDALVDGESSDLAQVVIRVGADWADTVGGERD